MTKSNVKRRRVLLFGKYIVYARRHKDGVKGSPVGTGKWSCLWRHEICGNRLTVLSEFSQ